MFSAVPSGPGLLAVRPPGPVGPLARWEHWLKFAFVMKLSVM